MNLYQIVMSNKPEWSKLELFCLSIILVVAFITAAVLYIKGKIKLSQGICGLLLLVWLLLVLGSTVLARQPGKRKYNLHLFWSWKEAVVRLTNPNLPTDRRYGLLIEILLNLVLLFPTGVLLPVVCGRKLPWFVGLLFGILISGTVEVLQLVTCRGFFEFDDIVHNSLGCMAGSMIAGSILAKHLVSRGRVP